MKKNAFTLVELLAVIAIISVIMIISLPELIGQLKNSKEDALEKTKEIIVFAAKNYVSDNNVMLPASISVETLCNNNYLDCPVKNPIDNTNLVGYVIVNTKQNYVYRETFTSYIITNIIENGSFENGTSGWNVMGVANNISVSTVNPYLGTHAMKRINLQEQAFYTQSINLINNHKYYASAYGYNTSTDLTFWDYTGLDSYQQFLPSLNYIRTSKLFTATSTAAYNSNLGHGVQEVSTGTLYVDAAITVDLTETFGAGNEPSKEWCDNNIDYFDGTETIYIGS